MDDDVLAAAEQLLNMHLEEDCVYCDDESCLAVTVAQAVLSAGPASRGGSER